MRAEVHISIDNLDALQWNRLVDDRYPFLRHEFLAAAENTGCVSTETGWTPRHIGIYDASGTLVAAMPLYEKAHSWGEFVFDWSWANAYEQAGLNYYPKLVSTAPFTPAPSAKLLVDTSSSDFAELSALLLSTAVNLAEEGGYSSLHVLFPSDNEHSALESAGFKLRKDCQFHWHNQGYESFDDFLSRFSSAKRKKARRDRRHVAEQGIRFRWLNGHQMDSSIWSDVYALISRTFLQRGNMPYFNLQFFIEVSRQLPDSIQVVVAEIGPEMIAAAVFYRGGDTLYGRYWGSLAEVNALHFETCYYQGIDYCIEHQLQRFEPGTQGEHKISRGFIPVNTWSAHWLQHPEFFTAIENYLDEEQRYVDRYVEAVHSHSPFRKPDD